MEKPLLHLLLVGFCALALPTLAFLAWAGDSNRGLADRALDDMSALTVARYPRPVQTPPYLPGFFGDGAAAPWTALAALQARFGDEEACRGVWDGDTPFAQASESCVAEFSQAEVPLQALLLSTHSEEAGPPPGLGPLDAPTPADKPSTFATAEYVARMSALRLRAQLAAGHTAAALTTCVETLALARDLSWGTGLAGRLAAVRVFNVAFGPCAAALDVAPSWARHRAALALGRLARGIPPLAATVADTSVALRAQLFAPYLSEEVPRLPPAVQKWATAGAPREDLVSWLRRSWSWYRLQTLLDSAVAAARLPPAEAQRRLNELSGQLSSASLGQRALSQLGKLALSGEQSRRQVLLLRRAAEVDALRMETGGWPRAEDLPLGLDSNAAQPFVIEDKGTEAVLVDATAPRGQLELRLHAE